MNPENLHASVEALQAAQQRDRTSLGIIKPKEFVNFVAEIVPEDDRAEYWYRYEQIMAQQEFEFEPEPAVIVDPATFT
jgi:hypothetical protein